MKKFLPLIIFSVAFLGGCDQQTTTQEPIVDTQINEQINNDTDENNNEIQDPTYTNDEYGFSLTFPETWSDYVEKHQSTTIGENKIESERFEFGLPVQPDMITLNILTKENWEKIKSDPSHRENPSAQIVEGNEYVFIGIPPNDIVAPSIKERTREIPQILKTLKITEEINNGITDWQTYSDLERGFQFHYPIDWNQDKNPEDPILFTFTTHQGYEAKFGLSTYKPHEFDEIQKEKIEQEPHRDITIGTEKGLMSNGVVCDPGKKDDCAADFQFHSNQITTKGFNFYLTIYGLTDTETKEENGVVKDTYLLFKDEIKQVENVLSTFKFND